MKLRAGIIGLGVGEAHVAGYEAHPDCRVTALCDFSPRKLREAKKKYPHVRLTKDADEILNDPAIDVVSIASYDSYHYEQAAQALRQGKHLFVEKPLCLDESEAAGIRTLLDSRPKLSFSSNLILRQSPRFLALKDLVDRGRFGRLYYVEGDYNYGRIHKITDGWRGRIPFYSVVYGGGVHLLDLLLWLTKDRVTEVSAYGNRLATKGSRFRYNDCVAAILRFQSGMVGKVTSNFSCVHPHFHPLALYGTKAAFVHRREGGELFTSRDPKACAKMIRAPYPGVHKGGLLYNFVDHILKGTKLIVPAEDVFRVMSVCFAIEKASRTGRPVKVRVL